MSININKDLVDFSSPKLHGPSTLNYSTYLRQRDYSTILAIANKTKNTVENIKLAQSWSDIRQSYKPHVQPLVELNLHNTLPRVKRSGSEIPGQAYDYRAS